MYDSRAGGGDTNAASVLEAFDGESDQGALVEARLLWLDQHAQLYAYRKEGEKLVNERFVGVV